MLVRIWLSESGALGPGWVSRRHSTPQPSKLQVQRGIQLLQHVIFCLQSSFCVCNWMRRKGKGFGPGLQVGVGVWKREREMDYRARQPQDRDMFLRSHGFHKESKISSRHSLFFVPLLGQEVGLLQSEDSCLEHLHPPPVSTSWTRSQVTCDQEEG